MKLLFLLCHYFLGMFLFQTVFSERTESRKKDTSVSGVITPSDKTSKILDKGPPDNCLTPIPNAEDLFNVTTNFPREFSLPIPSSKDGDTGKDYPLVVANSSSELNLRDRNDGDQRTEIPKEVQSSVGDSQSTKSFAIDSVDRSVQFGTSPLTEVNVVSKRANRTSENPLKASVTSTDNEKNFGYRYFSSNDITSCQHGDCSDFTSTRYHVKSITKAHDNLSELIDYVDANVCNAPTRRIAVETSNEQAMLVDCSFCSKLSDFGVIPKDHILTSGTVDTTSSTEDLSPWKALENWGTWSDWGNSIMSSIPLEVVLLNSASGTEESTDVLVKPGVYALLLMGTLEENCDLAACTYWKWGLIAHEAVSVAIAHIKITICEDIDPVTSTSTPTTTSPSSTTGLSSTTESVTSSSSTASTTLTTTSIITTESTSSTTEDFSTSTTASGLETTDSPECCRGDVRGPSWVCPGKEIQRQCPNDNSVGWQTVTCNAEKQDICIEDHCIKMWIDNVRDMIDAGNYSAVNISVEVRDSTNFDAALTPCDLGTLVGVLNNLTVLAELQVQEFNDSKEREDFLTNYDDNFVHITSNILSVPMTWDSLAKEDAGRYGGALLVNLEISGFLLADQLKDQVHSFNSSEVNMTVSATTRPLTSGVDLYIPSPLNPSYLHLPEDFGSFLAENETDVRFVAYMIEQRAALRALPAELNRNVQHGNYKEMNSPLISASLGKAGHQVNFTELGDVTIRFHHSIPEAGPVFRDLYRDKRPEEVPTPVPSTAICVYWDTANSLWSPDGCQLINTTRDVTYCSCQHLTMFAIITDIHHYIGRDPVLDILGTVLSTISCFSLFIAFGIFQFYKSIASPRVTITKQLCVTLGISQLLLLFLLDRDFLKLSELGCSISAMVLHYWLAASLCWMLAEGFHLFQTVSDVLSHISYMPAYWLLGYGIPAILVVTTVLIAYGLGHWSSQNAYAPQHSEYCWLSTEQGYIWAFTGPLIIVIVLNTVIMMFALRSAATLRTNRQKTIPEQIRLWVKGSFSLNCVLGTTWVFGFLYINTGHVFAYIFTIFNASQGMMILLLHCIVNDTVRTAIINSFPDWLSKRLKKQTPSSRQRTIAVISRGSSTPVRTLVRNVNSSLTTTTPLNTPPTHPLQRRNAASGSADVCSARPHKNLRHGSQLSNSTQMTYILDSFGNNNSPGTRRISVESYESSNSSSADESCMYIGDLSYRSSEDQFWNPDNPRYIPGFAAIQECEERSPRSDQQFSFLQEQLRQTDID